MTGEEFKDYMYRSKKAREYLQSLIEKPTTKLTKNGTKKSNKKTS